MFSRAITASHLSGGRVRCKGNIMLLPAVGARRQSVCTMCLFALEVFFLSCFWRSPLLYSAIVRFRVRFRFRGRTIAVSLYNHEISKELDVL